MVIGTYDKNRNPAIYIYIYWGPYRVILQTCRIQNLRSTPWQGQAEISSLAYSILVLFVNSNGSKCYPRFGTNFFAFDTSWFRAKSQDLFGSFDPISGGVCWYGTLTQLVKQ